jgi:hypothetical protein
MAIAAAASRQGRSSRPSKTMYAWPSTARSAPARWANRQPFWKSSLSKPRALQLAGAEHQVELSMHTALSVNCEFKGLFIRIRADDDLLHGRAKDHLLECRRTAITVPAFRKALAGPPNF